jgi:hypothetical protein
MQGACFPDSFAALDGAEVIADAWNAPGRKGCVRRRKHRSFPASRIKSRHITNVPACSPPDCLPIFPVVSKSVLIFDLSQLRIGAWQLRYACAALGSHATGHGSGFS